MLLPVLTFGLLCVAFLIPSRGGVFDRLSSPTMYTGIHKYASKYVHRGVYVAPLVSPSQGTQRHLFGLRCVASLQGAA